KFLPNISCILEPLHRLLQAKATLHWTSKHQKAFEQTKKLITEAPILEHFDPKLPIIVSADASPYGIGAVLAHKKSDGSEKPICFVSRTLSTAERNYSQLHKEALAIVFAVTKFYIYLCGAEFVIYTDHKP